MTAVIGNRERRFFNREAGRARVWRAGPRSLSTITAKPGERLKVRVSSMGKLPSTVMTDNVVLLKPGGDLL